MRRILLLIGTVIVATIAFFAFERPSPPKSPPASAPASDVAPAPPPALAPAPPPIPEAMPARAASRAPWAALERRYEAGDYAWLIANARAAPHLGSLHFAFRAISHCVQVRSLAYSDERLAGLKRLGAPDADVQMRALAALRAPCAELGDLTALKIEKAALELALGTGNDPVQAVVRETERLLDRSIPAAERERKIAELLALDDQVAAQAVREAVTSSGAIFEGKPIAEDDALAYRLAWELVLCSRYGKCLGPQALASHWECLNQSACDYRTTAQRVEALAGSRAGRVADLYARIERHLSARDFAAFGPP
jgi:hypothetical protein